MYRTFDVSNPRKSYAGHTVYRVSSKVAKRGFQPDVIEEVVVWRRFSEFKKLHKDLAKIYHKQDRGEAFPSLPKATFFDRFDEAVIEERRKSILKLLTFVADVAKLADSEYLEKFLGGGIYSPTGSSRASSFSGSEGDVTELNKLENKIHVTPPEMNQEPRNQTDEQPQSGYLELGGVWLCKQPSLVEGLDSAGTEDNVGLDSTQSDQTPVFMQRSLSFDDNDDSVFTRNKSGNSPSSSDSDDEESTNAEYKTSSWLQRAMSLCSEGEDIETLASEAENSEFLEELNFPKPFSDAEDDETSGEQESRFDSFKDKENSQSSEECEESSLNETNYNAVSSVSQIVSSTPKKNISQYDQKSQVQHTSISRQHHEPCRFLPQHTSFDCSGGDYLLAAANVVRDALSCELDGQYKEAFHLYKKCVSLLLNGVQEEKDTKRRDAVRRKTAQYLLKAEALYTAYVHDSNKEVPTNVSPLSAAEDLSSDDTLLQLTDFSVIGVIGKVILVERKTDKNTYVIKVLSKTEGHHSRHKSKRAKRQRQLIKAAYSICPFTVQLHQHCETETAMFLLLEYARGGLVWDYLLPVTRHQQYNKSQSYVHNLKETELNKTRQQTSNPTEPNTGTIANKDVVQRNGNKDKKLIFTALEGNTNPNQTSVESCVRVWMAEIVLAVSHLHSHGIICRDLNPNNLLLSNSGHILLSHFSTWIDVNEEPDLFSLESNYCAPELFKMEVVTMTADWWSVGALFYEMLIGETLASNYPWGIHLHTHIDLSGYVTAEAASLIKELLIVTPSERLGHGVNGVDNIKSHPFFTNIDWTTLNSQHQLSIN